MGRTDWRALLTSTLALMPELLEVEAYRRLLDPLVGATISRVEGDHLVCGGAVGRCPAEGLTITATRRIGKLLLLDTDHHVLGLHAGMTGSFLLDGVSAFDALRYAPAVADRRFIRLRAEMTDGRCVELHDPRRLARVTVDPDESRLGPDATTITVAELRRALGVGSTSPTALKARLLDQARIAGLGNLLADEICFQAHLNPGRRAATLSAEEVTTLHRQIGKTLRALGRRGGSDCGALQDARVRGGVCPRCGTLLERRTIGGRTTFSCPVEQV